MHMAQLDGITIPEDTDIRISRLVEEGEFADREEAVRELISSGLTVYRTDGTSDSTFESEFGEDEFGEPTPQHDDDYVF